MPFKNLEHDSLDDKGLKIGRKKVKHLEKRFKKAEEQEVDVQRLQDQEEWLSPENPHLWSEIDEDDV